MFGSFRGRPLATGAADLANALATCFFCHWQVTKLRELVQCMDAVDSPPMSASLVFFCNNWCLQ